jgi:hypothetical protein
MVGRKYGKDGFNRAAAPLFGKSYVILGVLGERIVVARYRGSCPSVLGRRTASGNRRPDVGPGLRPAPADDSALWRRGNALRPVVQIVQMDSSGTPKSNLSVSAARVESPRNARFRLLAQAYDLRSTPRPRAAFHRTQVYDSLYTHGNACVTWEAAQMLLRRSVGPLTVSGGTRGWPRNARCPLLTQVCDLQSTYESRVASHQTQVYDSL